MKQLLLAHRGDTETYPENTLESFKAAFESDKWDGIETDIQISQDYIFYCFHDDNLKRLTNNDLSVELLFWSDIKKYNLNDKNGNLTDYTIPRLEDLLILAKHYNKIINLEIKIKPFKKTFNTIQLINSLINQYDLRKNIIISSFEDYKNECKKYKLSYAPIYSENFIMDMNTKMVILHKNTSKQQLDKLINMGYIIGGYTFNNWNNSIDPDYSDKFHIKIMDKL